MMTGKLIPIATIPSVWASAAAVVVVLFVSGCSTASVDADNSAPASASMARASAFSPPDQYPNLNIRPQPAAAQFTPEESKARTAHLKALRARQPSGSAGQAGSDAERLRRLSRTHGEQALEAIERR
jgi:hypothetical protein